MKPLKEGEDINMRKFLFIFMFPLYFMLTAYSYPSLDSTYYITVNSNIGNNVTIYIPYNMAKYITFQNNRLISEYSSSFYGYSSSVYSDQIRFQPFQAAEYRTGNTYDWTDVTVSSIVDTNISFLDSNDFINYIVGDLSSVIFLLIGSLILTVLIIKRR